MDASNGHGASGRGDEPEVVRHEQYYFSLITFQVENCLFKLPRHFFEQSEVFQGMYTVAQADTDEGTRDQHPIYLAQTKREDFEVFLKVAVPMQSRVPQTVLSLQEWLAVLELAHKWDFKDVRQTAIQALDRHPLDVVQKIMITQKFEITEWACAAYEQLMVRESAMTTNEMKSLGFEFTSKMADARERLKLLKGVTIADAKYQHWSCPNCVRPNHPSRSECAYCDHSKQPPSPTPTVIRAVLCDVFGDPVATL